MDMFLVTAERERCSVPRSGNGRSGMGTRERFRSNDEKMHRKCRSSFRVHHSSIHRSGNSGDYRYVWTTFPLFLQPCKCILLIITLFPWLWAVHDTYCPIVVISSLFFSLIRIIIVFYTVWCAYHGKRIIWRRKKSMSYRCESDKSDSFISEDCHQTNSYQLCVKFEIWRQRMKSSCYWITGNKLI